MGGRGGGSGFSNGVYTSFNSLDDADTFFGYKSADNRGMFPDWEKAMSKEERNATILYTKQAYRPINTYLRRGEAAYLSKYSSPGADEYFGGDVSSVKNTVDRITSGMDKFDLKKNITVWRGGSTRLVGGATTVEQIKAMTGSIVRDDGVMSTAVTPDGMWGTSGKRIGYEIQIPRGKGRGVYVSPISNYRHEQEFMVRPGTRFQIMGAYTNKHGDTICQMRAVYD